MKTFKKVLKILGIALLLLIVVLSILVSRAFDESGKRIAIYKAYSPPYCRNTKWVCQEENIYFISDSEGQLRGQVGTPGNGERFSLGCSNFADKFGVYRPVEGREDCVHSVFGGDVSYSDGVCTFTYIGEDDEEHFWGDKTGEVTLTFVKEDLPKDS